MNEDILDEDIDDAISNRAALIRIIQISVASIILLNFSTFLKSHLYLRTLTIYEQRIDPSGFIFLFIIVMVAIKIPIYLNKINPKLNIIKIVSYTGLTMLIIEIAYRIPEYIAIINSGDQLNYFVVLSSNFIGIILCLAIANIKIHKIRNKKTSIPILNLIFVWIGIGFLMEYVKQYF